MRRIAAILFSLILLTLCVLPVRALNSASATVHATVSAKGECQVVVTATIHLDQRTDKLTFPVPREAYSIKVDGSRARTEKTDTAILVDLSKKAGKMTGDLPVTITYNLSDVVVQTETGPQVQIPLLSGFAYAIDEFEFSVTLPGQVTAKPAFSGGYQMAGIEKDLTYEISGPTISGSALTGLMDNETLLFTVDVPQDMFPRSAFLAPNMRIALIGMGVCAGLALVYWLLTLRFLPPRRIRQTMPPEGFSAGQLGSLLTLQGVNLTMMILSWAQLGYVTLQAGKKGHVLVTKRMDMGNERGSFELRCFQKLFRKEDTVDTSTRQYALLRQKLAEASPELVSHVRPRSGNPTLFRVLTALIALFCCGSLGIALSTGAILQWLLAILLAALGFAAGWHIQAWATHLFHMDRRPLRTALILCAVWLLLGLLAGQFGLALLGVLSQLLAGLMGVFGGLRTETGKQDMAQILGLHRHLRTLSRGELQRISEQNPDYLQAIAPYALALGLDRQLARRMGKLPLPAPTYLPAGAEYLPASQWFLQLRRTAERMDERYNKLQMERIYQLIRSFKKGEPL